MLRFVKAGFYRVSVTREQGGKGVGSALSAVQDHGVNTTLYIYSPTPGNLYCIQSYSCWLSGEYYLKIKCQGTLRGLQ